MTYIPKNTYKVLFCNSTVNQIINALMKYNGDSITKKKGVKIS